MAVDAVKNVEGLVLDYSPASLKTIDRIIQSFRNDGLTEDQVAETVFSFGCYAGEVFVRNRGARWVDPTQVMPPNISQHFPFMVVQLPDRKIWSPITKAFRELENGREDSLEYLYHASTSET
ncbi:hypothetical protein [Pseudoxanthomonas mexicana]|uniref:hypothetical protein n=1 Tax=Pseudoxanthomonas mexicana TaxID=128785 RepID=UPI001FD7233B|nr:hypothetical protein [Pseudoxanthomonas mexicana]UOV02039.1 hypothetical protein MUU73_01770 [Pseudoxanthomonas mexicana]